MRGTTATIENEAAALLPQTKANLGQQMHQLMSALYPICRSLTGNGQRRTLEILRGHIDLTSHEVPSGTQVFDWVVPKEWNIRDAYIKDAGGRKIVDFKASNLHAMSYSVPVHGRISLEELKNHLYSLPEHPDWIPYRTSYYQENWGFCLSHRQLLQMTDPSYEVCIDATLQDGALTYGEYFVRGEREDEVLVSCHICHPSMANDNLSGVVLATFLAKRLSAISPRYSYRFLFTPGTIGSITWLCLNEAQIAKIRAGLILACVGDSGPFTYKKSRRGDAVIDRAVQQVLQDSGAKHEIVDFSPYGYDERQFCSPAFNLPVGCFMRTPHGRFPEYHTSADDLQFVGPQALEESFAQCWAVLQLLEANAAFVNLNPKCEPQLGKRGLYGAVGGQSGGKARELALLWVLNMSDGQNTLLDIAERSGMSFDSIHQAAAALRENGLLRELG